MLHIFQAPGELLCLTSPVQALANQIGDASQVGDQATPFSFIKCAAQLSQHDGEQIQVHKRSRVGLGGCHPDLRAGVHADVAIRGAHGLGADHVHDAPYPSSALTRLFNGRKGIRGFARLTDGYHHRLIVHQRFSVAELGCDVHLNWQPRQSFDQDLSNHSSVRSCSTGCDNHLVDVLRCLLVEIEVPESHGASFEIRATPDGIGE